ncbi:hypothetical protein, partial [Marinobacter alexandrii]|uniref:hypothetical protein n=1 Tax=Marinobacter alexandrii TaxID=2570351 RepID=UPI0032982922
LAIFKYQEVLDVSRLAFLAKVAKECLTIKDGETGTALTRNIAGKTQRSYQHKRDREEYTPKSAQMEKGRKPAGVGSRFH